MLEDYKTAEERWGGVSETLDHWITERQDLIVLYCSVNGMNNPVHRDKRPLSLKLKHLCQLLVDYVSKGHFDVYEKLNQEGIEFNDGSLEAAQSLYIKIEKNTQTCIQFNDDCEKLSSISALQKAISILGETLEERFLLEDKLIKTLHDSHKKTD